MLVNASKLIGYPILSLHVGAPIARVESLVVDPNDLKIIAFGIEHVGASNGTGSWLETRSVREFASIGMIVDSEDEFVETGDVIRLDEVLELNFDVIGLKAETKRKTRLGKVRDFTVSTDDFRLMQIIVERPPLKALLDPELVIARSEITEVTDYKIIIKDEEEKIKKRAAKEDFIPNFVNPFREPDLSTAEIRADEDRK